MSSKTPSWRELPLAGRCYVAAVIAAGAVSAVAAAWQLNEPDAPLLTALAILSFVTAFAKVTVAVPASASTMSLCYIIDFTTLLILGPAAATFTVAAGAWSQSTFGAGRKGPRYRLWFSIAALALTVRAAGETMRAFAAMSASNGAVDAFIALIATATVYFVANSLLVASAVALTTGRSPLPVWSATFLPLWPSHLFGVAVAIGVSRGLLHSAFWLFPLTFGVLVLTHDKLHAYVAGLSESLADAMTGLPNLRHLQRHLAQEIDRAQRAGTSVAVLMIDLNGFKAINDTYGHRTGDRALRHVAQRLQASVRSYDLCARYAGDEFVVVLPGCDTDEALSKAVHLQQMVAEDRFAPAAGASLTLRISVGSAVFPRDAHTMDDLLAAADREMFRQKHRVLNGAWALAG